MSKPDKRTIRPPAGAGRYAGDDARRPRHGIARALVWLVVGALFAVGAVAGLQTLQQRVLQARYNAPTGRAFIRVAEAPQWMPVSLAQEILRDITPPSPSLADPKLAQNVYDRAMANPWVRRVQQILIRPSAKGPGGVVDVFLEFRRPLARIHTEATYIYVDAEGYHVPMGQVPMYVIALQDQNGKFTRQVCYMSRGEIPRDWTPAARKIHYINIDGVAALAPPPGKRWPGDDLLAGLRLVQLVGTRPYYAQISLVDVRNHACRITKNEPELRMYAQVGQGKATDIRFGRFPAPGGGDYIISPQRKMSYLDDYVADHQGWLAGRHSYLDLRFDELHVSLN